MYDTSDNDFVATCFVEDEIVVEAFDLTGTDSNELAEAPLRADFWIRCYCGECLLGGRKQPICSILIVSCNPMPVLLEIESSARLDDVVHRRREPFFFS